MAVGGDAGHACAMRDMLNLQTRWSKKMDTSRRRLLAGVGGLSLGAAVSAVQPRQAVAASEGGEELVAVAVNDALEGAYGRHKEEITRRGSELLAILSGQRRRHSSRDQPCSMAIGSRLLAGCRLPERTHRHPILSGALVAWV
jgi:hypothetical protein